jgi:DNA recombination protein RmuC
MSSPFLFVVSVGAGVIFGFVVAWYLARGEKERTYARAKADSEAERASLAERVAARDARVGDLRTELDRERAEHARLRESYVEIKAAQAEIEGKASESQKAAEEKIALLEDAHRRLSETFRALSAEALNTNNQAFLDLARATLERFQDGARADLDGRQRAIDELVRPLRESLTKVEGNLHEIEKARVAAYAGLSEQVGALADAQAQLRFETVNLSKALRSPSVRGRWGEIQLRRVVELAGMVEHCDFEEQPSVNGAEGPQRPDLIVHLPNRRTIVVDSKVSLAGYLESLDAPDEAARGAKLREHAAQVRSHLTKLSAKKYWSQLESTPEFVVAFLPGETFFSAALEQDPELIEFGVERRVILSTPTTLIALLKAVAYGWQQQRLAASADAISLLGRSLYDRLSTFTSHFEDVGRHLHRSVESFNRAAGSYESRVLASARRFRELGAASPEQLPLVETVDQVPRSLAAIEEAVGEPVAVGDGGGNPS